MRLLRRFLPARVRLNCNDTQSAPIFIVGSPRSGTTLLRRLLMTTYGVHIPPETYVLGSVARGFSKVRDMEWGCLVGSVVGCFQNHPEFRHFGITDMRAFVEAQTGIAAEDRSLEGLVDDLYRFFAREAGFDGRRWGDKTPYNTYFMPEIAKLFPGGRFVHMLRDGPDAVQSMITAGRYTSREEAARRWRDAIDLTRRFDRSHPGRMTTVRYEDLVDAPERELRGLEAFLDLKPVEGSSEGAILEQLGDVNALPHHANVLKPVNARSVGAGRRSLPAEEVPALARILDRRLIQAGYPALQPSR